MLWKYFRQKSWKCSGCSCQPLQQRPAHAASYWKLQMILSISRQKQCPLGLSETDRTNYKKISASHANCYQWQISAEIFVSLFYLLLIISSSLCQFPWCHVFRIPLLSLSVQFAKCLSSHFITKDPTFPLAQSPVPYLFLLLFLGLTSFVSSKLW